MTFSILWRKEEENTVLWFRWRALLGCDMQLIGNSTVITSQTLAFLEVSLTRQRHAPRLGTIYSGNLKCYRKYSCKMSRYLHAGELDGLKKKL